MGESPGPDRKLEDSPAMALLGKIMMASILGLFFIVVLFLFFHLYAKWFWFRRREDSAIVTIQRRRHPPLDLAPGHLQSAVASGHRGGLDPSALKAIPVVLFNTKNFKDGLECAVCLSELADGDEARLLPICKHGFHVDCIDMWFQSHSTCPLCRNPVSVSSSKPIPSSESTLEDRQSAETPRNFPTNVLFRGDEIQIRNSALSMEEEVRIPASSSLASSTSTSNRPDGMVAIDMPRPIPQDEEPKPSVTSRLRSLTRLLSGERDRRVNPCSSRDVEASEQV